MDKQIIVITGMHRSGTSALASMFADFEYCAGPNLIPADEGNPTGYWEDRDIFNLNNQILSLLNLSWQQTENSNQRRVHLFADELTEIFGDSAKKLIQQKLDHFSKVLIKDPRFTILLPFWNKVFEEIKDTRILIFHIVRHPMAVSQSLEKRNGFSITKGLLLWQYYNLAFFQDANPGFNLVHYSDLLNHPAKTVRKLIAIAGMETSATNFTDVIQPVLNHHRAEAQKLPDELKYVDDFWKVLNRLKDEPEKIAGEIRNINFAELPKSTFDEPTPKHNITLVANFEKNDPLIISQTTENISVLCFEINGQIPPVNNFSVYLNDHPCSIEINYVKVYIGGGIMKIEPASGNYALRPGNKFLFDSNLPYLNFELPSPSLIQKVELSIAINELQSDDLALINTSLKLKNKKQEGTINDLQKVKEEVLTSESPYLKELEKQKEFIAGQKIAIESLERKSLWLYNELNAAKNSLSWRATTPLRWLQSLLNRIQNRFYILINDIGASYRLLRREGIGSFANRFVWYLRGKRLKEEIEHSKLKPDAVNNPTPIIIDKNEKLIFEPPEKPQVSIIIPVFNNPLITWRCLKSISINTSNINFEVIIVDDHSTESLSPVGTQTAGIHLIRNSENLGFLKSCNKAAGQAKGKFICLLNNDTEVHEGWLEHLLAVFDKNKYTAIAGPKLVYPNGRLQEAGGIVWNDASAWNFGKFDDPEKPDYNYLKEVDYISGACLVIRKTVWDKLGGFDEQFAPAYYEDTDLAMKVRRAGYKVYYQPLSVVTHHEGLSNGTDETAGLKKFQAINHSKFLKKWEHTLSVEHSPNGINVFFHRDRSLRQKHLLVIDHYVPMYDQDAGSRSTFNYLKLLVKMGFKIHFIGDNYFRHEPYTAVLQQMGIEVLYGNYYQKNIRDWFRENGRYIDFVIAHRVHIAPKYFGMIRKFTSAKIAYIGHDLQYLGSQRKFEITGDKKFKKESAKFLKTETRIFDSVDVILPFSTYEEPFIKKLAPKKIVQVIPVYFFENIPEKVPGFDERRDVLFVGYFGHPPNPDAVLWFVKEIFPLVQQKIPDAKLHVVGSQPTDEVLALQNDFIKVTGYVSDEELANYYRKCKVAILPLRFGAGVKGKLLESLNHQIPTVITPVAAEGIPEIENHSLIAENPNDFAENIRLLYKDKTAWQKYSSGGRVLIEKHYTEAAARKLLEEILPVKD
jgi:GT2 family glycosyltransferase/glycosyltransferase involved in cell wall biosynthesis